jgi:hypothetical protein
LILATHGRSIWNMDDISALEEMNDQVLTSDLKLFGGRPGIEWKMANYRGFMGTSNFLAPNAPNGLIVDYYAKEAEPVHLTVTDKSGNKIRELTARAQAGEVNRTTWDMRYESPVPPPAGNTGFAAGGRGGRGGGGRGGRGGAAGGGAAAEGGEGVPAEGAEITNEFGAAMEGRGGEGRGGGGGGGGGRGFGAGRGALVDPGEYTLTIAAAGKTASRTVVVEDDPRVQISAEDRTRKRQALSTLATLAHDADASRRKAVAMNTALTNLTDSWKLPNAAPVPDSVKKAAEDLQAKVKTAMAHFETQGFGGRGGGGGGAGAAPPYTPPPVTQKITRLMTTIDAYSAPPTSFQMAELQDASDQLKRDAAEVDRLWDEVPKLNKLMTDAGVQYFKVDLNSVPAAGGRGGRGGN